MEASDHFRKCFFGSMQPLKQILLPHPFLKIWIPIVKIKKLVKKMLAVLLKSVNLPIFKEENPNLNFVLKLKSWKKW